MKKFSIKSLTPQNDFGKLASSQTTDGGGDRLKYDFNNDG